MFLVILAIVLIVWGVCDLIFEFLLRRREMNLNSLYRKTSTRIDIQNHLVMLLLAPICLWGLLTVNKKEKIRPI